MFKISRTLFFPLILLLSLSTALHAQDAEDIDLDQLFEKALQLAADGEYAEARTIAGTILEQVPGYHDVRIFRARTYAWQNRFSNARSDLDIVLSAEPKNADALSARTDMEYWSGNYQVALQFAGRWIEADSENPSAYLRRSEINLALDRFGFAINDLEKAESLDAAPQRVFALNRQIADDQRRNIAAFGLSYDYYTEDFEPWQRLYVEYHRLTNFGPVIARLNIAHRFDITGIQFEADSYPSFGENWYAYLNAGYSGSDLYPDLRFGTEIYRSLPRAMEASLGARYLIFPNDEVLIFTGSLSKYWRDWFFSARPFITPQEAGVSAAFNFIARRYFGDPLRFASFNGGFGFSPDERRLVDAEIDNRFQQSYYFSLVGNYLLRNHFQLFGEIKFTSQELPGFIDHTNIYTFETGIRYRF